jgi:hypothetical protein
LFSTHICKEGELGRTTRKMIHMDAKKAEVAPPKEDIEHFEEIGKCPKKVV